MDKHTYVQVHIVGSGCWPKSLHCAVDGKWHHDGRSAEAKIAYKQDSVTRGSNATALEVISIKQHAVSFAAWKPS
jgi:hypothetical protein